MVLVIQAVSSFVRKPVSQLEGCGMIGSVGQPINHFVSQPIKSIIQSVSHSYSISQLVNQALVLSVGKSSSQL